jgi:parallel beta-helix repeat protein
VTRCYVENCRAHGIHAGGGLAVSEFFENETRDNFGDGFYFCAKVTGVTVRDNKFTRNKASGVGGLGDSGDTKNVVAGNHCERNGTNGISLWDGEGNTVIDNVCLSNSQREPGRFGGISLVKTENSVLSGNRARMTNPRRLRNTVQELGNCVGNTFTGNDCGGNALTGFVLLGKHSFQSNNLK